MLNLKSYHFKGAFIYYVNNLGGRGITQMHMFLDMRALGEEVFMKLLLIMLVLGGVSTKI